MIKKGKQDKIQENEEFKLGIDDFLAICIAAFQVLLPYVLIFMFAFAIFLLFVNKIWLK